MMYRRKEQWNMEAHSVIVTALILAFVLHWRFCCCGCVTTVRLEGRR